MPYPVDPLASSLYTLTPYLQAFMNRGPNAGGVMIDIWGEDPTVDLDATKGEAAGNYILLYHNVPACLQPTQEYDQPMDIGQGEEVSLGLTLDHLMLHSMQPARNGQYFVPTVPGIAWTGLWWYLVSNAQANEHPAFRVSRYNCKRSPTPKARWAAPGQLFNYSTTSGIPS